MNSTDPRWQKVPAKILPKQVDPKHVAIMLADFHVAQKIKWAPHEKAGHVYRMLHELHMAPKDIATYLRASLSTDFCRWVGEGRLPEGENVRDLPDILGNPEAYKKFLKLEKDIAFAEAKKIVDLATPERASEFFKLLGRFREACRDAAQIKELLLIRSNKTARTRVLETYEAFVDFMRLADLEPPEIK